MRITDTSNIAQDADSRTPKTEELQKQKNFNDIRTPIF